MRAFFLQLYAVLMGILLLIMISAEAANNAFYKDEIAEEYLQYTQLLTEAIRRETEISTLDDIEIFTWWQQRLLDKESVRLDWMKRDDSSEKARITHIEISEAVDEVEIIVPFDATRALRFIVQDEATVGALAAYYAGYFILYLLMGVVIFVVARIVYRQLEAVRKQADRVARGEYDAILPPTRIAAFDELGQDMNRMTAALREKTQENHLLSAAIHHELRIPITRLRLALDMALVAKNAGVVQDLLQDLDEDLSELSRLMEDLLTLSRLRLANETLTTESVRLDELLKTCVNRQRDPRIQLSTQACSVTCHRPLLERAISNLVENACKYASERIEVSLKVTQKGILLDIGDDGPGIPRDQRHWVVKPFYRVDHSRIRNTGGSGLGLAIADLALKHSRATLEIDESCFGGALMRVAWDTSNLDSAT